MKHWIKKLKSVTKEKKKLMEDLNENLRKTAKIK